jgi:hypothetical protein
MRTRLIPAALLALAVMAAATSAWAFGAIPSYYEELNFNLTSPTGFSEAVSGYANPSMYPMMPGAELEVYWSSFKSDAFDGAGRWGTFIGLENLGFGFIHNKAQFAEGERSVTDYRLGLGGGSGTFTMGLGYAWSGGDTDTFGREKFFQLGGTARDLIDARSGHVLCPVRPLDKAANADALRRRVAPSAIDTSATPATGIAPLLKKMIADYAATGLPPAYLPTPEKDDAV